MKRDMLIEYRKKTKDIVLSPTPHVAPHHSEVNLAIECKCVMQFHYFLLVTIHRALFAVALRTPLWDFSLSTSYQKITTLVRCC